MDLQRRSSALFDDSLAAREADVNRKSYDRQYRKGYTHSTITGNSAHRPFPRVPVVAASVDRSIGFNVPQDCLHIFPRLREGYRLHKFIHAVIGSSSFPVGHAAVAGVIGGKRVFLHSTELLKQLMQITRAKPDIRFRDRAVDRSAKCAMPSSRAICFPPRAAIASAPTRSRRKPRMG